MVKSRNKSVKQEKAKNQHLSKQQRKDTEKSRQRSLQLTKDERQEAFNTLGNELRTFAFKAKSLPSLQNSDLRFLTNINFNKDKVPLVNEFSRYLKADITKTASNQLREREMTLVRQNKERMEGIIHIKTQQQ